MSKLIAHWALRSVGIGVTAFVVSGNGGAVDTTPSGAAGQACTIQCGSGSGVNCSSGWHKTWGDPYEHSGSGEPHSSCEEGLCYVEHPCSPGMEGDNPETLSTHVSAVREAIRVGDTNALLALVDNSQSIAINRERSAVQILDCQGSVFAHVPVNTDVLAPVLEAFGID
ncbi:MAG TPA: hypothetical protein VLD59_14020 [Steroidobacteraceae bacterium]|nr:hypothetical protein [Steroidobacteraceae bacterium]